MTDAAGRTERRLRRALIGVSMALAVALLLVGGVLLYWRFYLLGPGGDPFTRGPYLLRVEPDSAELRWRTAGDPEVSLAAVDDAGREIAGRGGVLDGLRPGTRYAWTASVDGIGRASGAFTTPSDDPAAPVRIAALADYGIGSDQQWAVARTIAA